MPGFMRVIHINGTITDTPYDRDPPLEDLHAVIGHIEAVPHWLRMFEDETQPCMAYVGSGAKGAEGGPVLSENLMATAMWDVICIRQGLMQPGDTIRNHGDYLAGPVIVNYGDGPFMRSMVE